MKKSFFNLVLIFAIFVFSYFFKVKEVNAIDIVVDPSRVLNSDFGQLLGGYISTRGSLDPSSRYVLSRPDIIDAARKMFPQPPEFVNPVVIRTQSYMMLSNDIYALTNVEVEDIIKFCSLANCEPMFGAFGINSEGKFDFSPEKIRERVLFVREKCKQYFGTDSRCKNWNIGNEPPTTGGCDYYGKDLIPKAIRVIREIIPDAIIHTPELFLDTAKVRGSEETVGECIARTLNSIDSTLKINVFTTHWYPYVCSASNTALGVDGRSVLSWEGRGGPAYEKMYYPLSIVSNLNSWLGKYQVTKGAKIGIGELNPMGACDSSTSTYFLNTTWGGAFWHLDVLGIAGKAGINYIQKHLHIRGGGGAYESMVVTNDKVIRTPPYYAYQFYSQYFGRRLVFAESSVPALVNSHASLDKEGNLRILLINKTESSQNVRVMINNFNVKTEGEVYVMKAIGGFNSGVAGVNESDIYKTESFNSYGNEFNYNILPASAVILKILGGGNNSCNCSVTNRKVGDANCDGLVNSNDFFIWKNEFFRGKSGDNYSADFNCDGIVDGKDFEFWRRSK